MKLADQTVLVTGATRGIGRTIAGELAAQGMHVFASGRDKARLDSLVGEIAQAGGTATAIAADLADEAAIVSLFDGIASEAGRLDVCINNAGVGLFDHVAEAKAADLDLMYATNVRGTFICCREAMRLMMPLKRGYIINISSVLGERGYANQGGYTATKHAVMGLTKSLAVEAQEHGIRVSAILPGGVDTKMVRQSRPDLNPEELLRPEDVAQTVLYLLSLSDRAAVDQIYLRRRQSKPF